jgi:hypothetical protein
MRGQSGILVFASTGNNALAAALLVVFGWLILSASAAEVTNTLPLKYEFPTSLTGPIYDSTGTNVLFDFKRSVTRTGTNLDVLYEYSLPDGKLAARETVSYHGDQLVAFTLDEIQTGATGSVKILYAPAKPASGKIEFNYRAPGGKLETATETLRPDTLTSDMIGPFLTNHWNELMQGREVKCRYLVVPRKETIGFTFSKHGETTWRGKPVVVVRMEASSWVVGLAVDPLFFTMEKDGQHRVLQYTGRTTPKIKTKSGWKDLDAVTVFNW